MVKKKKVHVWQMSVEALTPKTKFCNALTASN